MAAMSRTFDFIFDASTRGMQLGMEAGKHSLDELAEEANKADAALRAMPNKVDVNVGLDKSTIQTMQTQLRAKIKHIESTLPDLDVGVETDKAVREIDRLERKLRAWSLKEYEAEMKIDSEGLKTAAVATRGLSQSVAAIGANGPAVALAAAGLAAAGAAIAGPLAVGAVQVAAFAGATYGLLDAYDQLERGNQKFAVVFGEQADAVDEWARVLSTRVGVGVEELKGMASGIQDILVPIGFDRSQAADLTRQLYERGAALAEFSGADTADAISAITRSLTGEREALKTFGVVLTEAQVQSKMNALKNTAAVRGLTDQEVKALATMQLIEEQSTDAWQAYQDGLNTAGSSLNSMRVMWANFKDDVILGLGQIAVGIIEDLDFGDMTKGLAGVSDWIAENAEEIRAGMLSVASGAVAGARGILLFAQGAIEALPGLVTFAQAMGYVNSTILDVMGSTARSLGFNDVATALEDGADSAWKSAESMAGMSDIIETLSKDGVSGIDSLIGQLDEFGGTLDELKAKDKIRVDIKTAVDAGDWDTVRSKLDELGEKQVARIISELPEKDRTKTERKLAKLARNRRAEIKAEANTKKAWDDLSLAAKDRYMTIWGTFKWESGASPPGWDGGYDKAPWQQSLAPAPTAAPGNTTVVLDGERVASVIAQRTSIGHREVWV